MREMLVVGVGQFRSDAQNTVYLRVGTVDLRKITRKGDYDYNPHITLYDGRDHDLGDELFYRLRASFPLMKLYVSRLEIVETGREQASMDFLLHHLDGDVLSELAVDWATLPDMSADDRISVAVKAVLKAVESSSAKDLSIAV
jgi:hypothetical protein